MIIFKYTILNLKQFSFQHSSFYRKLLYGRIHNVIGHRENDDFEPAKAASKRCDIIGRKGHVIMSLSGRIACSEAGGCAFGIVNDVLYAPYIARRVCPAFIACRDIDAEHGFPSRFDNVRAPDNSICIARFNVCRPF